MKVTPVDVSLSCFSQSSTLGATISAQAAQLPEPLTRSLQFSVLSSHFPSFLVLIVKNENFCGDFFAKASVGWWLQGSYVAVSTEEGAWRAKRGSQEVMQDSALSTESTDCSMTLLHTPAPSCELAIS